LFLWALLPLLLSGVLVGAQEGHITIFGAAPVAPQPIWLAYYHRAEQCSRLKGDHDALGWIMADSIFMEKDGVQQSVLGSYYMRTIWLRNTTPDTLAFVIVHESIHHLLEYNGMDSGHQHPHFEICGVPSG